MGISETFNTIGSKVIDLLPKSPFKEVIENLDLSEYVGVINWFFPISDFIKILGTWLLAVSLFYFYSILLRWLKVIGD